MFGANYFSGGPIVLLRIDLGEYDEVFSNEIPGFYEKLKGALPSLYQHHCSIGKKGGFLKRVKEGTLLGHITEHIAIELQTLAGMDVAYGKTRESLQKGVYNVIFRFFDEIAGLFAGKAALNLVNSLLLDLEFDIDSIVKKLINIREERLLGPSTQAIVDEAQKRNIPSIRLDKYNLVQLGTGKYQKRIRATITSDTNFIAVETADNKHLTNMMLYDAGLPVPDSIITKDLSEIIDFYNKIKQTITVKPLEGYRGEGVSIYLDNEKEIEKAFKWAKSYDDDIIAQPTVDGNIYRMLVIDYKFCAGVKLMPPKIIGDGKSTVKELIDKLNISQNRGIGDKCKLTRIKIDDITLHILESRGLNVESVLPEGEAITIKTSGSMRLGSSAIDISDEIHPINKFLVERAAKVIGLNVAGIDVIAPNLKDSLLENNGKIIEINAAPDFRMHINPTIGKKRNAPAMLMDMLFPKDSNHRVPIISITGTVGKTITAHFLAYCLSRKGKNIGLTSTEGLYISGRQLKEGDMTYPEYVNLVLKDPTVDIAVLETSKEGILRRGLGYEFSDIGIVLNLYDDHIGTDDIKYIEDLAYAKSVVAEQVYDDGYAILSADYDLVLDMEKRAYSKIAYFSIKGRTEEIMNSVSKGSIAAIIEDEQIIILNKKEELKIIKLSEIPLTYNNKGKYSYESILASVLNLYLWNFPIVDIIDCLKSYLPDFDNLPGRMNTFKTGENTIIIDYAHNRPSFYSLGDYLSNFNSYKIGVIDIPGDRPDEIILAIGGISAQIFDEIIFYEGYDLRGRPMGQSIELLKQGALEKGFDENKIHLYTEPEKAWQKGFDILVPEAILTIITGRPKKTYKFIKNNTFPKSVDT